MVRNILLSLCMAAILAWGTAFAQSASQPGQNPPGTSPSQQNQPAAQGEAQQQSQSEQRPAQTKDQTRKEKLKKYSGKLVDVPCIAKNLSTIKGGNTNAPAPKASTEPVTNETTAGVPGESFAQRPGGAGAQGPGGQEQIPPGQTTAPGQNPYPNQQGPAPSGPSPAERAAQQCPATSSTTAFGLVLSDGKLVKFDNEGNAKAGEAIKTAGVKEGKAPKAQVRGTMEGDTVKVAEIRVKGQKASASEPGQAAPSGH